MQFWDMVGSTFGEGEERNGLKLMFKEESRNEFRIQDQKLGYMRNVESGVSQEHGDQCETNLDKGKEWVTEDSPENIQTNQIESNGEVRQASSSLL